MDKTIHLVYKLSGTTSNLLLAVVMVAVDTSDHLTLVSYEIHRSIKAVHIPSFTTAGGNAI